MKQLTEQNKNFATLNLSEKVIAPLEKDMQLQKEKRKTKKKLYKEKIYLAENRIL